MLPVGFEPLTFGIYDFNTLSICDALSYFAIATDIVRGRFCNRLSITPLSTVLNATYVDRENCVEILRKTLKIYIFGTTPCLVIVCPITYLS